MTREHEVIQREFERAAPSFSERTAGRFDHMGVVEFSLVSPHDPADRIDAARTFIAERGAGTGMEWEIDGDDWVYTRRRLMLLARRAR